MQVWKYASVPLLRQISVPGGAVFIYFVNRVLIFNNESFAVLSDNFGMRMHRRFLIVKRIPGYGFLFVHLISHSHFWYVNVLITKFRGNVFILLHEWYFTGVFFILIVHNSYLYFVNVFFFVYYSPLLYNMSIVFYIFLYSFAYCTVFLIHEHKKAVANVIILYACNSSRYLPYHMSIII